MAGLSLLMVTLGVAGSAFAHEGGGRHGGAPDRSHQLPDGVHEGRGDLLGSGQRNRAAHAGVPGPAQRAGAMGDGALCAQLGPYDWTLPPGFPYPKAPADNPMTKEKVELGRYLFYDRRLSRNETQSCGTCHSQARAFADGRGRDWVPPGNCIRAVQ